MTDTSDRRPPKIALVFPSSDQCVQSLFVYHKNHAIGHKPPQSTLILATYLKAMGFDDVTCIDAQLEGYSPEQTAEAVAALAPDIVGVTAWTDFWYPTWRTMKLVREKLPDCTIVAGGPHCSVYPQETVEHSEADYVVAGDGEDVLLNIV
ncbi:MAG: cobalamin-dependent protein, partial [Alphaproteobacteria bacterium]|nr:cobalamin-dependent protein [Alphaproteobacteria bacterium]